MPVAKYVPSISCLLLRRPTVSRLVLGTLVILFELVSFITSSVDNVEIPSSLFVQIQAGLDSVHAEVQALLEAVQTEFQFSKATGTSGDFPHSLSRHQERGNCRKDQVGFVPLPVSRIYFTPF